MTRTARTQPQAHRRRSARALAVAACATGLILTSGCRLFRGGDDQSQNVTTRPSTTQQTWSSNQPLPQSLQPVDRPVLQDRLPLIWLVDDDGTYRVTNVATGEDIASFPARAPEIIRVEEKGVFLANKPVIGATLAQGTYAIFKVLEGEIGTVQAQQTITRPVPAAATRPATRPAAPTPPPTPAATPPPQ